MILTSTLGVLCAQDPVSLPDTEPTQSNPRTNTFSLHQPATQDYIISPDDVLDIYVLDVTELSRTYRVSPTGMIIVPLLTKAISAAGLTPTQLAQVISDQLRTAGMVDHPQVTIQVKDSRLHSVAIAGAVKKPQIYPILGKTTLLDALSQAEGLANDAGNTAIITRGDIALRALGPAQGIDEDNDKVMETANPLLNPRTVTVDLNRLLEDGDASLNYDLYPGDRVTVQRAGIVYVVGAVNRAGGFVLKDDREQMTVLKALALAEFVTPTAKTNKAVIIRKSSTAAGGTLEIPVELNKIIDGKAKDRALLANDILFVPDSASKRALHKAGDAAAQAAALLVYRL
jgi:polysaccharide export outer membrane protein